MSKKGFVQSICLFLCIFAFIISIFTYYSYSVPKTEGESISAEMCVAAPSLLRDFPFFKKKSAPAPARVAYVGGVPIGFSLSTKGVVVVEFSGIEGIPSPAVDADIERSDIITHIAGEEVNSIEDIQRVINKEENAGKCLNIRLVRKGKVLDSAITPGRDSTGMYKLGLWIRDNAAGVGTLTYVLPESGKFGALGHPICDSDSNTNVPVSEGRVYNCSIIGITKGQRGSPGELRGMFLKSSENIGVISKNNKYGVFGRMKNSKTPPNPLYPEPVEIAERSAVKPGKAKLVTTVEDSPEEYDIEIVKASYQKAKDHKSMIIKVTDKRLLEKTGGIVQGMSGSPIIQNGKLVGAATHVFINDPTRGFGVYLDWMYGESG